MCTGLGFLGHKSFKFVLVSSFLIILSNLSQNLSAKESSALSESASLLLFLDSVKPSLVSRTSIILLIFILVGSFASI